MAAVAGIGFTVPLFVAGLAFPDGRFEAPIKLGLLLASVVAGAAGSLVLLLAKPTELTRPQVQGGAQPPGGHRAAAPAEHPGAVPPPPPQ